MAFRQNSYKITIEMLPESFPYKSVKFLITAHILTVAVPTIKATLVSRRVASCRGRTLRSKRRPKLEDFEEYLISCQRERI